MWKFKEVNTGWPRIFKTMNSQDSNVRVRSIDSERGIRISWRELPSVQRVYSNNQRRPASRMRASLTFNQTFGLGGGRSRALHSDINPLRPCVPSQNGLFSAIPHRQREIT